MKYNPNNLMALVTGYTINNNNIQFSGWIVSKPEPLTHVTILLNSVPVAIDYPLDEYTAISDILPTVPHAIRCLFHLDIPKIFSFDGSQAVELELIAKQDGREIGSTKLHIKELVAAHQPFPIPPAELQTHVGQLDSSFLDVGWRIFDSLNIHLEKYKGPDPFNRVLDWGCGCGRVARFMIEALGKEHVFGCDIDGVAIDWVKSNLNSWTFTRVNGLPPTPYPNNYFDLVYGTSVFTHLDEPIQFKWLAELRRIVRPGGLVAVSVLNAKELIYHPQLQGLIDRYGFADYPMAGSEFLDPFVDAEYYRVTFHSRQYISERWSEYFELLEYIELAVNVHQDLVIMRKK